MEFLFPFNISQSSYTTPPFLFDKSKWEEGGASIGGHRIGQLGAGKQTPNQLEAAAGGPRPNPSLDIKLILSHPPMSAPQSQGLAILSKIG